MNHPSPRANPKHSESLDFNNIPAIRTNADLLERPITNQGPSRTPQNYSVDVQNLARNPNFTANQNFGGTGNTEASSFNFSISQDVARNRERQQKILNEISQLRQGLAQKKNQLVYLE